MEREGKQQKQLVMACSFEYCVTDLNARSLWMRDRSVSALPSKSHVSGPWPKPVIWMGSPLLRSIVLFIWGGIVLSSQLQESLLGPEVSQKTGK